MKTLNNPYITNLKLLSFIKLGEKLDIPTITVDLIEDNFAPTPINFTQFKDCTSNKIGESHDDYNQIVENINKTLIQ